MRVSDDAGSAAMNVNDTDVIASILDGNTHSFRFLSCTGNRKLEIDGEIVFDDYGAYNYSTIVSDSGTAMDLLVTGDSPSDSEAVPGTMSSLCIQTFGYREIMDALYPTSFGHLNEFSLLNAVNVNDGNDSDSDSDSADSAENNNDDDSDSGAASSESDSDSAVQTTSNPQTTSTTMHYIAYSETGQGSGGWGCRYDSTTTTYAHSCGDSSENIAVRCCALDGSSGFTPSSCTEGATFDEAEALCDAEGARLCTKDEIINEALVQDTGCDFDCRAIWTSNSCPTTTTTSPTVTPPLFADGANEQAVSAHAAGSNEEAAIRSIMHSEWENIAEEERVEEERQSASVSNENVTVTLSTGTWMNLWGILVMALLINMAMGAWCLRNSKRRIDPVEPVLYEANV